MAFLTLPCDLYLEIGRRLNLADFRNLSLINRKFAQICSDDRLWRERVPFDLSQIGGSSRYLVKVSHNLQLFSKKWRGKYTIGTLRSGSGKTFSPKFRLISGYGGEYHSDTWYNYNNPFIPVSILQLKTLYQVQLQYFKRESKKLKQYNETSSLKLVICRPNDTFCTHMDKFIQHNKLLPNIDKLYTMDPKYGTLTTFSANHGNYIVYFKNLSLVIDELSRLLNLLEILHLDV